MTGARLMQRDEMALTFDIDGDPPGAGDLAAERERIAAELAVFRRQEFRFLIAAVISVVTLLGLAAWMALPSLADPGVEPNLVAVIGYFIPYFVFFMFFVGISLHRKLIERPREGLIDLRDSLDPADEDVLAQVADLDGRDPAITVYRGRVAARGRALTVAEARAIRAHVTALERGGREASAGAGAARRPVTRRVG